MAVCATTTDNCTPASVAEARAWSRQSLAAVLADHPARPDLPDEVALVVSELVTNAVRAGATRHTVLLRADRQALTVIVTDNAGGVARAQHPPPDQPNGRGLAIVGVLTSAWGTSSGRGVKSVWAELPIA